MSEIRELQKRIFENKVRQGFNTESVEVELLLILEELGEATRAYRRGEDNLAEEIVDIIIYCFGLLEILGVDAADELLRKVEKNEQRTYRKVEAEHDWGRIADPQN